MLYGISAILDNGEKERFEVRKKLMQLSRKYRKLDKITKKGIIQMEKNFLSYLNMGAVNDDLKFYLDHHYKQDIDLMKMWKGKDTAFERVLEGRLTVLSEVRDALKGLN